MRQPDHRSLLFFQFLANEISNMHTSARRNSKLAAPRCNSMK